MQKTKKNTSNYISIVGARENNLKNINIDIPKNQLVVVTGLSGSGKSSLAFKTIYAEGQRRYLESLSPYARQFLGNNDKPDVDSIEGLSPSISIDQKSTSHNPRSTVGTVTEIYDFLRLLWSRVGDAYCVNGHGKIKTTTIKQIIDQVLDLEENTRLQILAPVVKLQKGAFKNEFEKYHKQGFMRVLVDGEIYSLDDKIELDKNQKHNISIIIDRIVLNKDNQTKLRITDAIETALNVSNGLIHIITNDSKYEFSLNHSCDQCGFNIPEFEPRLFSFNSPVGACHYCKGLGFTFEPDVDKIIPDKNLSINEGGIDYFKNTVNTSSQDWQRFSSIIKHYDIDPDTPIKNLTKKEINYLLEGSDEPIEIIIESKNGVSSKLDYVEGIAKLIQRRHLETNSSMARDYYSKYTSQQKCKTCDGKKLSPAALSVKIGGLDIVEFTDLNIKKELDFILGLEFNEERAKIAKFVLKEILDRLHFLINVGLEYLTLSRNATTLSGGESQRIRLATQIGSRLSGVLYVLDEPSIGLHQKDNDKLIETLISMKNLGNSLIIVEHDEDTMLAADYLIDIGPGAGIYGGKIVAAGTVDEVKQNPDSLTGQYLSKKQTIEVPKKLHSGNGQKIIIKGASANNLKNINVEFPLNKFVVVTGVSGSGKSTLVNQTLVNGIEKALFNKYVEVGKYKSLIGINSIDKIVKVSQDPIGRTPRSNPATYVSVFDDIREVFANVIEAKTRGYTKSRFSFNVSGGRCDDCQGDGVKCIEMHFLPNVYVKCTSCNGKKYNEATLEIKYKNKSIYDVLEMSCEEALEFFKSTPSIYRKLQLMCDVGLGYLKLSTNATELSGGEAQRIKLAKHLQRKATGKTIYVLDEPTTGLHSHDIKKLLIVLNRLVENGDSVIVIEHNLDLIKVADHVIDLGPNGGDEGGYVVCTGTPQELVDKYTDSSYTAKYLAKIMKN
ncbi:excinuclease ABC subunit UvrA [Mycoplasma bradburyae]|uniref:excinuclease ABC subunit UvrA n=1 Tax=Mycoplasma bradburyae TaxID=2963128 RepID=UPI002340C9B3|nr:excinuclease ABC subunit UvrA [Mycoplasma bradburyae]MDC4183914.1 excinuclease ABC subunit UvrA [Mycoplasma bradburyae]